MADLYPYQYAAYWTYQYLISTSGPDQATNLDGFFVDNLFPYFNNKSPDPTDYSRVGSPGSVTDATFQEGQADFMNYGRGVIDPTRGWGGNWWNDPTAYAAPPFTNNLDIGLLEAALGWDPRNPTEWGAGTEYFDTTGQWLNRYVYAMSNTCTPNSNFIIVDCIGLTPEGNITNYPGMNERPYQAVRYNMALTSMGDGFFYDDGDYYHNVGPYTCREWDERVGGTTVNSLGWLGAAVDAQQTTPRIGGSVYYRDFQNGRVYLNARGAGTVTIDLTGFKRITSTSTSLGNPTINNGTTGGTYDMPPAEGLFVLRDTALLVTSYSITTDGADTSVAFSIGNVIISSATTDGADTSVASMATAGGITSATTDGPDVSFTRAFVYVDINCYSFVTDGADTSVAALAITGQRATSATTDGADASAAVLGLLSTATSAKTDGADASVAYAASASTATAVTLTGVSGAGAVGTVTVWGEVFNSQTSNWANIVNEQSSGWVVVSNSTTNTWTDITTD